MAHASLPAVTTEQVRVKCSQRVQQPPLFFYCVLSSRMLAAARSTFDPAPAA